MVEMLSPWIYTQEIPASPAPPPGVSTSNFGVVGWTEKGPANQAVLITSVEQFYKIFGNIIPEGEVPLSVIAFFANGGLRAYVVRVVPADSKKALQPMLLQTEPITVDTLNWTNGSDSVVPYTPNDPRTQLAVGDWIRPIAGGEWYKIIAIDSSSPWTITIDHPYTGATGTNISSELGNTPLWDIEAANQGIWANKVRFYIEGNADYPRAGGGWTRFNISILEQDANGDYSVVESYEAVDPKDDSSSSFMKSVINSSSEYIKLTEGSAWGSSLYGVPVNLATGVVSYLQIDLAGGLNGTLPVDPSLVSSPTLEASKAGIYALDAPDEMMNVGLPDYAGNVTVQGQLIDYCQNRKDKFAIVLPPSGQTPQQAITYMRTTLAKNSSYYALYYPWVIIADPLQNSRPRVFPPIGHIAGVYARTDNSRNVSKAPAGITDGALSYVIGVEYEMTKGERDAVYPARVNPIVQSPYTGRAVWGARTGSLDPEWKYIQVRRLFMFIEKSLYVNLFWVVFETNGPDLWTRVRLSVGAGMLNWFRDGLFAGSTPAEAFQVVCDESNNPQSAIDAGILTVDIYIAPNKPSEFVRLRFQQKVKAATA